MKKILIFVLLYIFIAFHYSCNKSYSNEKISQKDKQNVLICTGKSSLRYHKSNKCMGLSNCKGERLTVTYNKAKREGRTPCKLCYKN
jgi:hypothetical protein